MNGLLTVCVCLTCRSTVNKQLCTHTHTDSVVLKEMTEGETERRQFFSRVTDVCGLCEGHGCCASSPSSLPTLTSTFKCLCLTVFMKSLISSVHTLTHTLTALFLSPAVVAVETAEPGTPFSSPSSSSSRAWDYDCDWCAVDSSSPPSRRSRVRHVAVFYFFKPTFCLVTQSADSSWHRDAALNL